MQALPTIIDSKRKTGGESFHFNGKEISERLLKFWQWSSSELLGNTLRGVFAEYLVATDLGCVSEVRQEWDAYDLMTQEGLKIEVKSSSYLQSWKQNEFSKIKFGIQPARTWEFDGARSIEFKRQSDVYVFCILSHKEQLTVGPLNLSQWDFYIIKTSILNQKLGEQKTITLSSLLSLDPIACKYGEILGSINSLFIKGIV